MDNFQVLKLEEQKRLSLTQVSAVDSFTEEKIRLSMHSGRLTVMGEKLKILTFSEGTGEFCCEGVVRALSFDGNKISGIKRLFK